MESFVIDTNCLIHLHGFSHEVFPSLWENFHSMVDQGIIFSLKEVQGELNNSHGKVKLYWNEVDSKLQDQNMEFFKEIYDDDINCLTNLEDFEEFQKEGENKPFFADPLLIATAMNRGCVVLTDERRLNSPKSIPYVCKEVDVSCMNLTEFMIYHGWQW